MCHRPSNPRESSKKCFFKKIVVSHTLEIPTKVFFTLLFEKWMSHRPLVPSETSGKCFFEKMIVSQTRESVFALHFEQWMCHRPSRPPRTPAKSFFDKICKYRKHYLLWIFSILICVRDMLSHNSVNFKLKNNLSISPTNEVRIFTYKFIDFDFFHW